MYRSLTAVLIASVLIAGCGKRSTPNDAGLPADIEEANALLPSQGINLISRPEAADLTVPIARVTELRVEPGVTGSLVVAEGIAARQGAYAAELRPTDADLTLDDGVLTFEFRVAYPSYSTPAGSERSRTVTVGYDLRGRDIEKVRSIRVTSQSNTLESRRR